MNTRLKLSALLLAGAPFASAQLGASTTLNVGTEPDSTALEATGTFVVGSQASWSVTNAAPSAMAFPIIGFSTVFAPFKQGPLVPAPDFIKPQLTSAAGTVGLDGDVPATLPSGTTLVLQYWIAEVGAAPAGRAPSRDVMLSSSPRGPLAQLVRAPDS